MNISGWRFCKVRRGQKVPYPANWQNKPLRLDQIPKGDNYGLLSGVHSGILAIDFDGLWAFNWWQTHLPHVILPNTIAWTSGRPDRVQMAFTVPKELWPFLHTTKFSNGLKKPLNKGIEFRWNGCQSVLPPSVHPDTGEPYVWVGVEETAAECPLEVLEFLIQNERTPKPNTQQAPTQPVSLDSPKLVELDRVMREFKQHYPNLSYDQWRDATWCCMTHVGINPGMAVMMTFYPEQVKGEYDRLAHGYNSANAPGIGSLIQMIRDKEPKFMKAPVWKDQDLVAKKLREFLDKHK